MADNETTQKKQWLDVYLKGIEGCVVVSAEAELIDDGDGYIDAWPTLTVRDPNNGNVEFTGKTIDEAADELIAFALENWNDDCDI